MSGIDSFSILNVEECFVSRACYRVSVRFLIAELLKELVGLHNAT